MATKTTRQQTKLKNFMAKGEKENLIEKINKIGVVIARNKRNQREKNHQMLTYWLEKGRELIEKDPFSDWNKFPGG